MIFDYFNTLSADQRTAIKHYVMHLINILVLIRSFLNEGETRSTIETVINILRSDEDMLMDFDDWEDSNNG